MPYTGSPGTVPSDEVRFLLGDTDANNPKLTDGEVNWLLATYEEPVRAAYQGAVRLLARYSGKVSKRVGPTSIDYSGLVDQYKGLIAQLAAMGGDRGTRPAPGAPVAGGLDDPMWSDVDWTV